jgi:hypothetical protein
MKLIYINRVGKNWEGNYIYEFLFSDSTQDVDGEDWDAVPASGRPEAPHSEFVKSVGRVITDIKFNLVQDSDTFAVWDAVDGIVALAWEDIDGYDEYPESRLWFSFGMDKDNVNDTLYERDLHIEYNKEKISKKDEN